MNVSAPVPSNEAARLRALIEHNILDTPDEEDFDTLVLLAAEVCAAPTALVTLVDDDRQWFKAAVGFDVAETPRDVSFCAHAITDDQLLVVEDARLDERFADNPLVTGEPAIRFYAGAPLVTSEGHALGALCVVDYEPRGISERQALALRSLARQAVAQLELRAAIADRERAERRSSESERRLLDAQRVAAIGSWEWDLTTGAVTWSKELYRLHGVPEQDQDLGLDFYLQLIHPDDRERVSAVLDARVPQNEDFEFECRIVRPDGETRFTRARGAFVFDEEGQPLRVVGTTQDVTDTVLAERARQELEARLRQSERLETVGQLAGGVAHDFNNLLVVILNCASFLSEEMAPDSPLLDDVAEIRGAAERAARVTGQLLTFSQRQPTQQEPVQLNDVVAGVQKLLTRVLSEDVRLVTVLEPSVPPVSFETGQADQMVVNLILNARDALPQGGQVTVETTHIASAEEAPGEGPTDGPRPDLVRLAVTDTGTGMPEEVASRAFEPFFTTKGQGLGTGLGLATIYGAARQAGGYVELSSEVGKGTTVEVFLPAHGGPLAVEGGAETPSTAAPQSPPARRRILLVEDDDAVRKVVCRILERHGYEVLSVSDGQEALLVLVDQADPIDLVLTDLVMPGIPGHELVAQLRELQPGLRAAYMSGYSEGIDAGRGAADDATPVLEKPFTAEELLTYVEGAVAS